MCVFSSTLPLQLRQDTTGDVGPVAAQPSCNGACWRPCAQLGSGQVDVYQLKLVKCCEEEEEEEEEDVYEAE